MGWTTGGWGGDGWPKPVAAGGGGPATPLTIFGANLVAWYDAQDLSTITKDGTNRISEQRDKSGNNYHLEIDVAAGAASAGVSHVDYLPTGMSGGAKPGTSTVQTPYAALGVPMGVSQFALFMVVKTPVAAASAICGFAGGNTGNSISPAGSFGVMTDWGSNTLIQFWRTDTAAASVIVPTANSQYRLAFVFDATTGVGYVNGVAGSPITFSQTLDATGTLYIGSISVGFNDGSPVGEFALVKGAVSNGQNTAMDAYFAGRW